MNQDQDAFPTDTPRIDGPDNSNISPPTSLWFHSLRFKLGMGLLILFGVLVFSNLWLIWFRGLPLLIQQNKELYNQIGENIITKLNQQFVQAQTLTKDIANLLETLPTDPELVKRTIPHMLNLESMRSVIAGGGVWPEPFAFSQSHERSSFFWGKANNDQLRLFDNYNDPDNPDYHRQEWYVPATLLEEGAAYWSRSYTDPYSFQPMVTCSVPYYRNQELQGIATVDLKLEGVNKLVLERLAGRRGYAFVVDRNNKFISFPDPAMVSTRRKDNNDKLYPDFIYVNELAANDSLFQPIADRLSFLSHRTSTIVNRDADKVKALAKTIAERSDQIELQEARLIAMNLHHSNNDQVTILERFETPGDLILHGRADVTIYQMPNTNWKVVTVFPIEDSIQAALAISKSVTWGSLTIIALWGLLCILFLWRVLFSRLQEMTRRIRLSAQDSREIPLPQKTNDELGVLAHWYNLRTRQLQKALKSAEVISQDLKRENNERKATAKLLERSVATQRAILDSANLAIITLDNEGRILSCNAGTTKILGYHSQDLVGKIFPAGLVSAEQLDQHRQILNERYDLTLSGFKLFSLALDQDGNREDEWVFTHRNGKRVDVLLSITAIIGQQHSTEGWLAVAADVSQRKRALHQP